MKRYHFNCGDNANIGFTASVLAETKAQAVERIRQMLRDYSPSYDADMSEGYANVEWLNFYFNADKVTEEDIDEEEYI